MQEKNTPTPAEVKQARKMAGLTQQEAADTVYISLTAWQYWEYGKNTPQSGLWELFLIKTGQLSI